MTCCAITEVWVLEQRRDVQWHRVAISCLNACTTPLYPHETDGRVKELLNERSNPWGSSLRINTHLAELYYKQTTQRRTRRDTSDAISSDPIACTPLIKFTASKSRQTCISSAPKTSEKTTSAPSSPRSLMIPESDASDASY